MVFIESPLGEDIRVEEVARAAGYSYYHLNRQFTAVLGERVGSYIKKRRLADAAQKLLRTDQKIIDIALENCFDSPEAFSRAFKAVYQVSPQVYRRNRLDTLIGAKDRLSRIPTVKQPAAHRPESCASAGLRSLSGQPLEKSALTNAPAWATLPLRAVSRFDGKD